MSISNDDWHIVFISIVYVSISMLVAGFYMIYVNTKKPSDIKNPSKNENNIRFFHYFISSFIAILLAPLILKSIGNDILKNFSGSYFEHIEIIGYTTLIALGRVPLIKKMLVTHFGDDAAEELNEKINDATEKLNEKINRASEGLDSVKEVQAELVKSSIEIEQDQKENIIKLCSLVRGNNGFIEISKVPEDLKLASEIALSKTIIVISQDNTKYKLTELGRLYSG